MTRKQRRLVLVGSGVAVLAIAVALMLNAFNDAIVFFNSPSDVAAAANMSDEERREMVRGMIARLADRLRDNGTDVEGWLRLVRAYVVLGDRDKAKDAAADARRALVGRPEELKRVDELIKTLGLEG